MTQQHIYTYIPVSINKMKVFVFDFKVGHLPNTVKVITYDNKQLWYLLYYI